ncbi:MAG: deoxyribonuclease IV [Gemmatimonadota bacterium]|jgi:deoxyribonuclease-4
MDDPAEQGGRRGRSEEGRPVRVPEGRDAADAAPDPEVPRRADELGAHVSAAGGVDRAPARAVEIESVCFQLFTKQPSRWAEPTLDDTTVVAFGRERRSHRIRVAGAHDSYLINLASPDPALWERSARCFEGELRRCATLGLDFLVTHPGNATDGDLESGLVRNADGVTRALERVGGPTRVLLEITAGSGTTVGDTFERLAAIIEGVPAGLRDRVGVCVDTCHAFAAGYDLVGEWEGVWSRFDDVLGADRLGLFHLNDSKHPFGSRKDRHEHLGEGSLGVEPFRRLVLDERFTSVPKLLETPKEDDPVELDLRNLNLLRRLRREGVGG